MSLLFKYSLQQKWKILKYPVTRIYWRISGNAMVICWLCPRVRMTFFFFWLKYRYIIVTGWKDSMYKWYLDWPSLKGNFAGIGGNISWKFNARSVGKSRSSPLFVMPVDCMLWKHCHLWCWSFQNGVVYFANSVHLGELFNLLVCTCICYFRNYFCDDGRCLDSDTSHTRLFFLGPLLLTGFNFNTSMDKWLLAW